MELLKKNIKWIILAIVLMIIVSGVSVYATSNYLASQVTYKDGKTVEQALNELYSKNEINITSETINGVGSVSYTFQENFRAACIYVYDGYNTGSNWSTTCENSNEIYSHNWPSDKGYTRYILLQNIKKEDVITASHSGNSWGVTLYIVFIK